MRNIKKERYEINSKIDLERNDISYIMNKLNNYSLLNKIVMIRKKKNKNKNKKMISILSKKCLQKGIIMQKFWRKNHRN